MVSNLAIKVKNIVHKLLPSFAPLINHIQISKMDSESLQAAKKLKMDGPEDVSQSETWTAPKQVTNEDCFITEYATTTPGFRGILKHRFSDFIVHEIDKQGNLIKLTSFDLPPEPQLNLDQKSDSPSEKVKLLEQHLSSEQMSLLGSIEPGDKNSPTVNIPVDNVDKDTRRLIHDAISSIYPHLFTVTKDLKDETTGKSVKMIAVGTTNSWKGKTDNYWSRAPGKYVHFTVYQENHGTFNVVHKLANLLHFPVRSFAYAGTKDKRSVSTQRMSIFKGRPNNLIRFNRLCKDQFSRIAIGNIVFAEEPLSLGQLKGNQFTIVYRDVRVNSHTHLQDALNDISTHGFINYFGVQRFGAGTYRSDEVGLLIIKKRWKDVVLAIMSPKHRDIVPKQPGCKSFNTVIREFKSNPSDANRLYKQFIWKNSNEGIILDELSQYPNNYCNAFLRLPRNARNLYLHAYQSRMWNRIVSYRMRKFASQVLLGDLVATGDPCDSVIDDDAALLEGPVNPQSENGKEAKDASDIDSNVTLVDESNINNFTIFDVVMPLIGSKTRLPENELGKKMLDFLSEDGLTMETFTELSQGMTSYGAYRKVIVKPLHFSWTTASYSDDKEPLVQTDLDILNATANNKDGQGKKENSQGSEGEGKTALIITLSLPSSSYATVFSRELMKEHLVTNS